MKDGLEGLQKTHRQLIYDFVTGKIDLEQWKKRSDKAFSVFRQRVEGKVLVDPKQLEEIRVLLIDRPNYINHAWFEWESRLEIALLHILPKKEKGSVEAHQ